MRDGKFTAIENINLHIIALLQFFYSNDSTIYHTFEKQLRMYTQWVDFCTTKVAIYPTTTVSYMILLAALQRYSTSRRSGNENCWFSQTVDIDLLSNQFEECLTNMFLILRLELKHDLSICNVTNNYCISIRFNLLLEILSPVLIK